MFEFKGTLKELREYIYQVFNKKTAQKLELKVDALNRLVQAHGTLKDVSAILRTVFTEKHLASLQVAAVILQPMHQNRNGIRLFNSQNIPDDVTLAEVHHLAKIGSKIGAIKAYRIFANVDLITAKNYVESIDVNA